MATYQNGKTAKIGDIVVAILEGEHIEGVVIGVDGDNFQVERTSAGDDGELERRSDFVWRELCVTARDAYGPPSSPSTNPGPPASKGTAAEVQVGASVTLP